MTPKTAMPSMMRLVAIVLRIKISERFIVDLIEDYRPRSVHAYAGLLHLCNGAIKTSLYVQIGPVELRAHDLLDVGAALLFHHEFVHAVLEADRAVAELPHFGFVRRIAVAGHDAIEVELQGGVERRRPLLRAAAARV